MLSTFLHVYVHVFYAQLTIFLLVPEKHAGFRMHTCKRVCFLHVKYFSLLWCMFCKLLVLNFVACTGAMCTMCQERKYVTDQTRAKTWSLQNVLDKLRDLVTVETYGRSSATTSNFYVQEIDTDTNPMLLLTN